MFTNEMLRDLVIRKGKEKVSNVMLVRSDKSSGQLSVVFNNNHI
jgi:undecaprenyl pyrophosphate synthase